jgi:hypothetical protein
MTLPARAPRERRVDVVWVRSRAIPVILAVTFASVTAARLVGALHFDTVGIDARIYRLAAAAAVAGQDPWATTDLFRFAGTPPSLVMFLPAVLLPEPVTVVVYAGAFALTGVWILRRLHLPLWWLLFPPLSESISTVNQNVLVLAFMLASGAVAGIAVVCTTYAVVPLLLQRRWLAVALGLAASALLLPLWIKFFEQRDEIGRLLADQSDGGLSAWGAWWLFVPAALALIDLRGHGASWLVIPALWPATQLHYSVLALPVARRSPLLAFLLCFANPLLPPFAVLLEWARVRLLPRVVSSRMTTPRAPGWREPT